MLTRERLGRAAAAALAILAAILVAARLIPGRDYDRGIYISVAERLRAGDRLYADVWDNKDPLFYWLLALGRTATPYADFVLEAVWLVVACVSVHLVGRRLGVDRSLGILVAYVATPLLLTGELYAPGATHLPGIAVALASLCACLWNRPVAGGIILAILCFLKLILLPLALALIVVGCWRTWTKRRFARFVVAYVAGCATFLVILGARGELDGYLSLMGMNLAYSSSDLLIDPNNPIGDHLRRSFGFQGAFVFLLISVVLVVSFFREPQSTDSARSAIRVLREMAGVALVGGLGVLAITGMWRSHGQTLYLASTLSLLLIARQFLQGRSSASFVALALLAFSAVFLSGVPYLPTFLAPVRAVPDHLAALTRPSPETGALLRAASSGRYARIGMHDDLGHAEGLGSWTLACPRFHQYPFNSPETLDQVLECASVQPYLLVSESAVTGDGWEDWNRYIAGVESALARDYECRPYVGGRLCTHR